MKNLLFVFVLHISFKILYTYQKNLLFDTNSNDFLGKVHLELVSKELNHFGGDRVVFPRFGTRDPPKFIHFKGR